MPDPSRAQAPFADGVPLDLVSTTGARSAPIDPGVLNFERIAGHSPFLVQQVYTRDDHACKELLAELRSAADLLDTPDLQTGRLQVDDQD
jgi:hypothetical protein